MPGTELRLGPFIGGINTLADASTIADNELRDCVNFEPNLSQELESRPPIQTTTEANTWTERIIMLGVGFFSGTVYVFGGNDNGTYYFSGGAWTRLSSTFKAVACIQYNDKVYFLNKVGGSGISRTLAEWTPGGGFVTLDIANLNTMIPGYGGGALAIYKERLWIVPGISATSNQSRLVFSDAGAPSSFSETTQFIEIKKGDGDNLVDVIGYTDNLILFKEHSTHILQYTTRPTDAIVYEVSSDIGSSSQRCVVNFESSVFVFHTGRVYEMDGNFNMRCINVKAPFEYDATSPGTRTEEVFLCRVGERLVCRYFNRIYVFGLRTRVWSRWVSDSDYLHNFGPFVRVPSDETQSSAEYYYAGSCITGHTKFFLMKDSHTATDVEYDGENRTITCSIQTKNYTLASPFTYKKLYHWGADLVTTNSVEGIANPLVYSFNTSWGTLYDNGYKARDLSTWATPLTQARVTTTVTPAFSGRDQLAVRFAKTLRFRKINFELEFTTNGSSLTGPVKLFTISMFVNSKQRVSESIS